MRFNIEHYKKYRQAAGKSVKDGMWDVTQFPNGKMYPLLWETLGYHGETNNYELLGTQWKNIRTNEIYEIDNVCYHWDMDYYIHVSLRKEGTRSHGTAIQRNINSKSDYVVKCVVDFHCKFKQIN